MPCFDIRSMQISEPKDRYQVRDEIKLEKLNQHVKKLEAGLCAIITELEKRHIANEVISEASVKGKINLMDFWKHHRTEDEVRLAGELHRYSEHERDLLKKLLNGK